MYILNLLKKIIPAKPAWKSKDYLVRIDAVKQIENQKILEKIALKDPYCYQKNPDNPFQFFAVRDAAIQKLNSAKILKKIELSDNYYLNLAAEKRLYFLQHGKVKYRNTSSSYYDARNDMGQHQSPFGFKR